MTLRDRLPSTGALFIFDAAARHRNFTNAAKEFNVTQPAVSRAVGALEKHLGCRLFDRLRTHLELTEEGRLLHGAVQGGFGQIEQALEDLTRNLAQSRSVSLSITSAFALHWFMPRLARLHAALPEVTVNFDLIHGEPYGPLGTADLGIRHNARPAPGLSIWPGIPEMVIPVCSPGYLERQGSIDAGLSGHRVAVLTGPMRIPWESFMARLGKPVPADVALMEFSDYALLIQAANKGQCVALGWWNVVSHLMETGELVPAGSDFIGSSDPYCIVARGGEGLLRPAVQQVEGWIRAEYAGLGGVLERLLSSATVHQARTRSEVGS